MRAPVSTPGIVAASAALPTRVVGTPGRRPRWHNKVGVQFYPALPLWSLTLALRPRSKNEPRSGGDAAASAATAVRSDISWRSSSGAVRRALSTLAGLQMGGPEAERGVFV